MVTHSYSTVTATAPLFTLEKAKKQLRIETEFTAEDDLIESYNSAAQVVCENFINRSIDKRDFIMECDVFDTVVFERNYENDVITKIEYYKPGETELTLLAANQYQLRNATTVECSEIKFLSKPETATRTDAVIITIAQGWDVTSCPKPVLQAIALKVSDFYERREDRDVGNNSISCNLLRAYRKY